MAVGMITTVPNSLIEVVYVGVQCARVQQILQLCG